LQNYPNDYKLSRTAIKKTFFNIMPKENYQGGLLKGRPDKPVRLLLLQNVELPFNYGNMTQDHEILPSTTYYQYNLFPNISTKKQ
jgi:hypothetical protein